MNKNVFTSINCFIQEIHCHRVGQREVLTALGIQTMIVPARNDPSPSKRSGQRLTVQTPDSGQSWDDIPTSVRLTLGPGAPRPCPLPILAVCEGKNYTCLGPRGGNAVVCGKNGSFVMNFTARDWTHISCIGRQILYHYTTWEACYKCIYGQNETKWKKTEFLLGTAALQETRGRHS